MNSLTFDVGASPLPDGLTPLDLKRLKALGPGRHVSRRTINTVCGTPSAGNQWIDKSVKSGLLVPIKWGTYRVSRSSTLDAVSRVAHPVYRRLVAWAMELPDVSPMIAFLAPRVWRDTELNLLHPAPVVPAIDHGMVAPQVEAIAYDLHGAETWRIPIRSGCDVQVRVPSLLDTLVLLMSNAHPLWREVGLRLARQASAPERLRARQILVRMQRADGVGPDGSAIKPPEWWAAPHRRGVEQILRAMHAQ